MKKKDIYLILVIGWMIVIFIFSSFEAKDSDKQSKTIDRAISNVVSVVDKDITPKEKEIIVTYVDYPVRKLAHISEYLILAILVFLYINCFKIKYSKKFIYTLIVCVVYAITDEIHQIFSPGRAALFTDILIDAFGSSIGLFGCYLKTKKKTR